MRLEYVAHVLFFCKILNHLFLLKAWSQIIFFDGVTIKTNNKRKFERNLERGHFPAQTLKKETLFSLIALFYCSRKVFMKSPCL